MKKLLFLHLASSLAFTVLVEYLLVTVEIKEFVFVAAGFAYVGFVRVFYRVHKEGGVEWPLKRLLLEGRVEKEPKLQVRDVGLIFIACVSGLAVGIGIYLLGLDVRLLGNGLALIFFPSVWLIDAGSIIHAYARRKL